MRTKIKILLKGIVKSIKYSAPIVVTMSFCCGILLLLLVNNYSNKINKIKNVEQLYGEYHLCINSSDDVIEYLRENDKVYKVFCLREKIVSQDGVGDYNFVDATADMVEYTQYRLVEGRLPEDKTEAVVSKSYLYKLGLHQDEIIGRTIEIPIGSEKEDGTYNSEKRTVTGIICNMSGGHSDFGDSSATEIGILMDDYSLDDDSVCAYVRLKDIGNVEEIAKQLKKHGFVNSIENGVDIVYNNKLLDAAEVSESGKDESKRQAELFLMVEILVMAVGIITIVQVMRLFFQSIKEDLIIFRTVGVPDGVLACFIGSIFVVFTITGALVGSVVTLLGAWKYETYLGQTMYVPWDKYIYVVVINVAVVFLFVFFKALKLIIDEFEISDMGQSFDDSFLKNVVIRGCLCENTFFMRTKIIVRNINLNIVKKITTCLLGTVAIVMIVMAFSQAKEQIEFSDDNYEYKYRIDVLGGFYDNELIEASELYSKMKDIFNANDSEWSIGEYDVVNHVFSKSELDDNEKKLISREKKYKLNLQNVYTDDIQLPLYVMGYSENMLEDLCKKNNIDIPKDNEAIFLNRTVNRDNSFSGGIKLKTGRKIACDVYISDEHKDEDKNKYVLESQNENQYIEFDVIGEVDELPVYPEDKGNYIVMVIKEDMYEYFFNLPNMLYPDYIYIKDENEELINEIAGVTSGTDYFYITDQEDEIKEINRNYIKRIIGYVFVAIFTGIFAIFNSIITTRMEYELKRKDLTVYRLLGVSRFTILFIQLMEVIVLDAASIAVGVYAAKRLIEYLTLKGILYATAMTGKEIAAMVAFGVVLMLSKIICITLNYHRDERKNVIC